MTRVAIVDIGTNSTRLLLADVDPASGTITDLQRRSEVTRLGAGVDASGRLAQDAIERVFAALELYREPIESSGAQLRRAVLTSAVRDAANGADFTEQVRSRFGLDARTIAGEQEARLSFAGATSGRPGDARELAVLDIGGGSTELVTGRAGTVRFHVSTQAGVVRQSERHIAHDPPLAHELGALSDEVREIFRGAVPAQVRADAQALIAVAGTATSLAAIDQQLEPYDSARVDGYVLTLEACERIAAQLAQMTTAQRRDVPGLHPARAPTIVAGSLMLIEALRAFELDGAEVSEHDILHGVALDAVRT